MQRPEYDRRDFDQAPLIVFYEMTRACDLRCSHCRADAQPLCHPAELTSLQAKALIDQLTEFPKPPLLVLTGGDPLKRGDVFELVDHAARRGLSVAMTPSATPLVTRQALERLKQSGLHRLAVSLDGAEPKTHDGFRRVHGSFQRTLDVLADARSAGLPLQINTTVARHNVGEIDAIADLIATFDIELWSVFFLVPTGRALASQRLSGDECEAVFEKLLQQMNRQHYAIKTTEAPHFRRFLLQRRPLAPRAGMIGTNDGRGVMFVSHIGEIFPSGFLPICCGRFPVDSLVRVYQTSELFVALRDGSRLGGKCGACEFRNICGGSRARAFGISGDPLAEERDCIYDPAGQEQPDLQTQATHLT